MTRAIRGDVSAIAGARYVQVRLEFTSDAATGVAAEASAVGVAWTN